MLAPAFDRELHDAKQAQHPIVPQLKVTLGVVGGARTVEDEVGLVQQVGVVGVSESEVSSCQVGCRNDDLVQINVVDPVLVQGGLQPSNPGKLGGWANRGVYLAD